MKTKFNRKLVVALSVVALVLGGGVSLQFLNAQTGPQAQTDSNQTDSYTVTDFPPDVATNDALVEVIRLTQSGVSGDVISNYIFNCQYRFDLTANQLIYLNDIGVPDSIVMAMISHDQKMGPAAPADTSQAVPASPPVAVDDNYFYDSLSPYGSWVVIEGYGRCWRPAVVIHDASWRPYCDHGHWVYTDYGWYWQSDYSWGWATFHYGRWFYNARYGWCWWPDTVWAPSWVCWRYSDDYCGWAPLPPRCEYREGVGLVYNGAHVSVGFSFGFGASAFTFVPVRHFCDREPWHYRVEHAEADRIYNRTTVVNDFTVNNHTTIINHGIPPRHISDVTHTPIHEVTIRESNRPVARGEQMDRDGHTLVINRPHFSDRRELPRHEGENRNDRHDSRTPVTQSPGPSHNYGAPYNPGQNNPPNRNDNHQPGRQPVTGQETRPHPPVFNGGNQNDQHQQTPPRIGGNDNAHRESSPPVTQPPGHPVENQHSTPAPPPTQQRNNGAPYDWRRNNNSSGANNNQSGQQPVMPPRLQQTQPTWHGNNEWNRLQRDQRNQPSQQPSPENHAAPPPAESNAQHNNGAPFNREQSPSPGRRDYQPPQNNQQPSHDSSQSNQSQRSDRGRDGQRDRH